MFINAKIILKYVVQDYNGGFMVLKDLAPFSTLVSHL